jgi:hypothetical protein
MIGRSEPRNDPVSRAPTTTAAVTSGRNAIPSKVSRNCAIFSGAASLGLVTAVPAASRNVRYSAFAGVKPPAVTSSTNPATSTASSTANTAPIL